MNWFLIKKRPTLVFLHGFNSQKNSHLILEQWCKANRIRYGKFDQAGHGKRAEETENMNYDHFKKEAINFINNVKGDNIILLGHSMGGALSIDIYENFTDRIKLLILEDPLTSAVHNRKFSDIKNFKESGRQRKAAYSAAGEKVEKIKLTMADVKSVLTKEKKATDVLKEHVGPLQAEFIERTARMLDSNHRNLLKDIMDKDRLATFDDKLKKVQCPTLILFGEFDAIVPVKQSIDYLTKLIPNNTSEIVKGSGHAPLEINPSMYLEKVGEALVKNGLIKNVKNIKVKNESTNKKRNLRKWFKERLRKRKSNI